jgi:hypothetical protein
MISRTTIPRREPELIEAEARQLYRGDTEKVATTSLQSVTARGIEITSRYNKVDEFELMVKMVNALPASLCKKIKSIWCDSKACQCFTVVLRAWNDNLAREVGVKLQAALLNMRSGHNGIAVEAGTLDGPTIWIDPEWGEDIP